MEIRLENLEGCKKLLHITLPSERTDEVYNELLADFRKNLQIPGFRKGKVPEAVIRGRFAEELRQEVIGKLVPEALDGAIKQENLSPVEQPTLDEVEWGVGEPMRITAAFEARPELAIEKFQGLEIRLASERAAVTEEMVDQQQERLRVRAANFRTIESREAAPGDFALIDLRGEPADETARPFRRESVLVEVSEDDSDGGFARRLVRSRPGENLEFTVRYPGDFDNPALAGREIDYSVTVLELKERMLPELDDDFARDLGPFKDLEELRTEIRGQLEADAAREHRRGIEDELVGVILAANPGFEIPQVMLERDLAAREEEMRDAMRRQGVNPDHIGFNWTAFRDRERPAAEKAVRRTLLLSELARKLDIQVSIKRVNAEIKALAERRNEDFAKLRREMLDDGSFEVLRRHILVDEVLDKLIELNNVAEV